MSISIIKTSIIPSHGILTENLPEILLLLASLPGNFLQSSPVYLKHKCPISTLFRIRTGKHNLEEIIDEANFPLLYKDAPGECHGTKNDPYSTKFNVPFCLCTYGPFLPAPKKMSPLNTLHLHTIFNKLDKNGDGLVSLDELMWLLGKIGVSATQDEVRLLVGKDTLDPVDFLFFYQTLLIKGNIHIALEKYEVEENDESLESDLRKAFRVFDLNDDGFISCEELQIALSKLGLWEECSGKDCKSMIGVFDVNKDGLLDFEEFKNMMWA